MQALIEMGHLSSSFKTPVVLENLDTPSAYLQNWLYGVSIALSLLVTWSVMVHTEVLLLWSKSNLSEIRFNLTSILFLSLKALVSSILTFHTKLYDLGTKWYVTNAYGYEMI